MHSIVVESPGADQLSTVQSWPACSQIIKKSVGLSGGKFWDLSVLGAMQGPLIVECLLQVNFKPVPIKAHCARSN